MYKIVLDDNSFIVADDDYVCHIYNAFGIKKSITAKELSKLDCTKYHFKDQLTDKLVVNRSFRFDEFDENLDVPVGSRIKYAKDIRVGDLVEGDDGKPRVVNELHNGEDEMYEIEVNGKTYTVNAGHILALVDRETGERMDIQLNTFLHMPDDFKARYVMEIEDDE